MLKLKSDLCLFMPAALMSNIIVFNLTTVCSVYLHSELLFYSSLLHTSYITATSRWTKSISLAIGPKPKECSMFVFVNRNYNNQKDLRELHGFLQDARLCYKIKCVSIKKCIHFFINVSVSLLHIPFNIPTNTEIDEIDTELEKNDDEIKKNVEDPMERNNSMKSFVKRNIQKKMKECCKT